MCKWKLYTWKPMEGLFYLFIIGTCVHNAYCIFLARFMIEKSSLSQLSSHGEFTDILVRQMKKWRNSTKYNLLQNHFLAYRKVLLLVTTRLNDKVRQFNASGKCFPGKANSFKCCLKIHESLPWVNMCPALELPVNELLWENILVSQLFVYEAELTLVCRSGSLHSPLTYLLRTWKL